MKIMVEAEMDRSGNITVKPVSPRIQRKYANHMQEMTGNRTWGAFFNDGAEASQLLEEFPAKHRRELEKGWPVRFKVDPWTFGHWLGYDSHEVSLGEMPGTEHSSHGGPWRPASGGTEKRTTTRSGRRVQYMHQPSTGTSAYIDLDTDIFLTDEEAQREGLGAQPSVNTRYYKIDKGGDYSTAEGISEHEAKQLRRKDWRAYFDDDNDSYILIHPMNGELSPPGGVDRWGWTYEHRAVDKEELRGLSGEADWPREYKFFVVNGETRKVESGWEYREDAMERAMELAEEIGPGKAKVLTRGFINRRGFDWGTP